MPTTFSLRSVFTVAATAAALIVPAAPASAALLPSTLPLPLPLPLPVPVPLPCVAGVTCPTTTPPPPSPAAPRCAHTSLMPAAGNLGAIRRATLCLLNVERTKHGLGKLRANGKLRAAAQPYANMMVAEKFFDHVSPGGSTFIRRVASSSYLGGANGWSLGENLAWGGGPLATAGKIVRAWMHSPEHRHNILTASYRDIGIGIALGTPVGGSMPGATYVNEFGKR